MSEELANSILEKIYTAGLKFLTPLTPYETYVTIVDEAIKLVKGDEGRIILEEDGEFRIVYSSSPAAKLPRKVRKKGFVYTAFTQRQAFYVNSKQFSDIYPEIANLGLQWAVFIPLSYRNKTIGVLVVQSYKSGHFTTKQLHMLKVFGSMASSAIRKMQLYDETKKALESRDLFISMAAHELRTPITTIKGYAELLYRKNMGSNTQESRWITELNSESIRLASLVNDLLEINRIRTGKIHYVWKECSLRKFIARIINNFEVNYPNRKFLFTDNLGTNSDKVIGDPDKLFQVVTNLLDNAVKFSSPPSSVEMTLDFKAPFFILTVKDYGDGILRKDFPKIFEEFYQGDKNSTKGMGLGLYIANRIIREHRGSIKIRSKVGKGTIAEVRLRRIRI